MHEADREWTMLLAPAGDGTVSVTLNTIVETTSYAEAQRVAEAGRRALVAMRAVLELTATRRQVHADEIKRTVERYTTPPPPPPAVAYLRQGGLE